MLKVSFTITFDKNGNIQKIDRSCRIPRPVCDECKFKEWCDRVENSITKVKENKNKSGKEEKMKKRKQENLEDLILGSPLTWDEIADIWDKYNPNNPARINDMYKVAEFVVSLEEYIETEEGEIREILGRKTIERRK